MRFLLGTGGHDAHATPSSVVRVFSKRGFHGQERAVVNVMAQLQRSPTPPSVPASRSSRKFVQLPARRQTASCWRLTAPTAVSDVNSQGTRPSCADRRDVDSSNSIKRSRGRGLCRVPTCRPPATTICESRIKYVTIDRSRRRRVPESAAGPDAGSPKRWPTAGRIYRK